MPTLHCTHPGLTNGVEPHFVADPNHGRPSAPQKWGSGAAPATLTPTLTLNPTLTLTLALTLALSLTLALTLTLTLTLP